jgi:hypothetical protein
MGGAVRESLSFDMTDVNEADWAAFTARQSAEAAKPTAWRGSAVWLVIMLLGAVVTYAARAGGGWLGQLGDGLLWFWVGVGVGAAAAYGLLLLLARANRQTLHRLLEHPKNRWANGPWRVRVGPEGLTRKSAECTQTYGWPVVNRIEVTDTFAFFFTGHFEGHLVPRSAFASDEDFRSFVRQARRLRDDAGRDLPEALEVREASEGVLPAGDITGTRARPHERGE